MKLLTCFRPKSRKSEYSATHNPVEQLPNAYTANADHERFQHEDAAHDSDTYGKQPAKHTGHGPGMASTATKDEPGISSGRAPTNGHASRMPRRGDRYSNDTPDSLRPVAPPGSRRPPAHEGGTQGRHAVQTSYSPSSNSNYLKPREASPAGFSHAQNGFKDPPAPAPPSPAVKSMVTHHAPPQPADSYVDDDSNFRNDVLGSPGTTGSLSDPDEFEKYGDSEDDEDEIPPGFEGLRTARARRRATEEEQRSGGSGGSKARSRLPDGGAVPAGTVAMRSLAAVAQAQGVGPPEVEVEGPRLRGVPPALVLPDAVRNMPEDSAFGHQYQGGTPREEGPEMITSPVSTAPPASSGSLSPAAADATYGRARKPAVEQTMTHLQPVEQTDSGSEAAAGFGWGESGRGGSGRQLDDHSDTDTSRSSSPRAAAVQRSTPSAHRSAQTSSLTSPATTHGSPADVDMHAHRPIRYATPAPAAAAATAVPFPAKGGAHMQQQDEEEHSTWDSEGASHRAKDDDAASAGDVDVGDLDLPDGSSSIGGDHEEGEGASESNGRTASHRSSDAGKEDEEEAHRREHDQRVSDVGHEQQHGPERDEEEQEEEEESEQPDRTTPVTPAAESANKAVVSQASKTGRQAPDYDHDAGTTPPPAPAHAKTPPASASRLPRYMQPTTTYRKRVEEEAAAHHRAVDEKENNALVHAFGPRAGKVAHSRSSTPASTARSSIPSPRSSVTRKPAVPHSSSTPAATSASKPATPTAAYAAKATPGHGAATHRPASSSSNATKTKADPHPDAHAVSNSHTVSKPSHPPAPITAAIPTKTLTAMPTKPQPASPEPEPAPAPITEPAFTEAEPDAAPKAEAPKEEEAPQEPAPAPPPAPAGVDGLPFGAWRLVRAKVAAPCDACGGTVAQETLDGDTEVFQCDQVIPAGGLAVVICHHCEGSDQPKVWTFCPDPLCLDSQPEGAKDLPPYPVKVPLQLGTKITRSEYNNIKEVGLDVGAPVKQ